MKIFSIFKAESLKNSIKNVIKRFPISIIIILWLVGIFISLNHLDLTNQIEENLIRINFSLIITFFLSIWAYIFSESSEYKNLKSILLQIWSIIFWIFFFFWFDQNIDNFENFIFFTLSLVWIISLLFFAPYTTQILSNKLKQSVFYTYFYNISVVFLTSFILGWVLFVLWSIWIWATFELFDLNYLNDEKVYIDWMITSLCFITPIFALTRLPNKRSFRENHFNENIFFSFLVKYIAIPFIYIYFIILYAYTIKVLSNFWNWPKWEVSWMVIGFSIFGYVTYIFSYIFEQKNKFILTFRKAFPYVVIPQIFMLSYAIYLRIAQYDITINRYFVVVFGLWLFIISLYYIFSKVKHLSFIVSTLTLFTVIISIWPWSVYNLPESRQYNLLESNLLEAWILKDWKITPLNDYKDISPDLSQNIYSEIDYLCDFSDCNNIKSLFSEQYEELIIEDQEKWEKYKKEDIERYKESIEKYKDINEDIFESKEKNLIKRELEVYDWPSKWEIVRSITEKIKVERNYWNKDRINSTMRFNIEWIKWVFPLDIDWYKYIYDLDTRKDLLSSKQFAYIDLDNNFIEFSYNWKINKLDITPIIKILEQNYIKTKKEYSKEELSFEIDWYKVIFDNITIENPEYSWGDEVYEYINGYLLVK